MTIHPPKGFNCTKKQRAIMQIILEHVDKGKVLTISELCRTVPWGPIRVTSGRTSVIHLEYHGFLKRVYAKSEDDLANGVSYDPDKWTSLRGLKMYILPTPAAYEFFRS